MSKTFINGFLIKEKKLSGSNGEYSIMTVGIKVDEFIAQLKEIEKESGFANIVIKKRKTPSDKGLTHYAEVDDWEPNKGQAVPVQNIDESEIPF